MNLTGIIQGLNKYEGLFGKLGILTVILFLLFIIGGFTSSGIAGKIMTLILLSLVSLIIWFAYEVNKDLNE
ncbi:hypothetical protein [Thermococcus sp. Bubb.Bath]|uniref:hypothetical protein n=1 Tax=Thermococcus sp. Bubb.Bath TaxID=1638242 RepID=UPI00143902A0|nr:hypothetical protein [Thermococcus sp. Bubb.Bath]NJF25901.1 hypothetical protein [Thermococcus sp. Bubb.Bath]